MMKSMLSYGDTRLIFTKEAHNILYAYNTDKVYSLEEYLAGYPGDEYIDMLSIDWYGEGESLIKM